MACARFLFSPCLPFYVPFSSSLCILVSQPTSHFANRRSISPLFSAAKRLSSLSDRRTTRAATARYLLYLENISTLTVGDSGITHVRPAAFHAKAIVLVGSDGVYESRVEWQLKGGCWVEDRKLCPGRLWQQVFPSGLLQDITRNNLQAYSSTSLFDSKIAYRSYPRADNDHT